MPRYRESLTELAEMEEKERDVEADDVPAKLPPKTRCACVAELLVPYDCTYVLHRPQLDAVHCIRCDWVEKGGDGVVRMRHYRTVNTE